MTLTNVPGFRVGHAEVEGGGSGCTVILGPFRGAVEVRGLATGTREMDVLSPHHLVEVVDAVLLAGGSAFGLAAADGVMGWLGERGLGFDTGVAPVPLVPGAVIFDLAPDTRRPGPAEGRKACQTASTDPVSEGRVGAGAGARLGKVLGAGNSEEGGLGSASHALGQYQVGALAVVNALGDVVGSDGEILRGARSPAGGLLSTDSYLETGKGASAFSGVAGTRGDDAGPSLPPGTNTTLVVVGTDLPLSRVNLGRVARMASGGLPRAISPVNTPFDGDVVFVLSSGGDPVEVPPGELLSLGVVARKVTEESIRRAVSTERRGQPENTAGKKASDR
jgi:L-aminopeptidase/D-esterase-like protein